MQALSLREPRRFEMIDIREPEAPALGEALVRVCRIGICGTDLGGYLGKMPLITYPRILGHELGVEVLAVGEDVTGLAPGDLCAVEPYLNCGHCNACRIGRSNCCRNLKVLGVHVDGGMTTKLRLPAAKLHPAPGLRPEQAALVETLGIGCHCVDRAAIRAGEPVLILGAGPIGLAVMEFARLAGAEITVVDLLPQRLDFCRSAMGVRHAVQATMEGTHAEVLRDISGGEMFPVVIDATGHAGSMMQSVQYLAHTGRLVLVGITSEPLEFHQRDLHVREATLLASRNALPGDFQRIIELITTGRIDTTPWITHRLSLEETPRQFEELLKPESGAIKAVVEID